MKTSEFSIILQSIKRKNKIVLIFLDNFCLYEILNNKLIIIRTTCWSFQKYPHTKIPHIYLPDNNRRTDGRTMCCWSDSPRISGVDIFIHKPNKQYPSQPPSSRTICCYVSIYFCFSVNTKFQENLENLPKISTIYYRFIFGRFPASHAFAFFVILCL